VSIAPSGGDPRRKLFASKRPRTKPWPLQTYFVALVALFVIAAVAATLVVHFQTDRDARQGAIKDARFAARTAAKQLGSDTALLRATVANLAANPQIGKTISHPAGCTLTFGTSGSADHGHIDILRPSGVVVCSSRPPAKGVQLEGYAREAWVRRANVAPVFRAPFLDTTSGARVALVSMPVPGHGIVAGFVDLRPIGPMLASLYGGGRPVEFLVTSRDGRTVIARSIQPGRWVGASLAGTSFSRAGRNVEHRDLDGRSRYYAEASVPGVGWRFYVGVDKSAALAASSQLEDSQRKILLLSLAVVLIGALFVYRRIAAPIRQLSAAVRASSDQSPRVAVPTGGPAEVATLADDVNGLIASVNQELLERQRAEVQLGTMAAIVESSGDAVIGKTFDGVITSWNSGAERMYGYSAAEAVGRAVSFLAPPDREHEVSALLGRVRRGEAIESLETVRVRADGRLVDVSLTISPIKDERGAIIGASTFARDITSRLRTEEQLRQAQKMEAIGSLASGVAHDFNNVLMVIRTCGALLLRRLDDEDLRSDVVQIDSAAQRAAQLTQQLLALGRRQVLRPEVTDLNSVAEETLRLLRRLIGEDITIVCELDPDLKSIVVDRSQLVQVILNLGVNARDAMAGGGTLTIRTANVDLDEIFASNHIGMEPGPYTLLQVTDSGVGMDDATKERVFDPFFTTKGDGTGLGLATVYGIVKQSGGHIWLYSEPGMGTTFKIYFPITEESVGDSLPAQIEPRSFEGPETILLVEDDDAVRPLVAQALRLYGYTVLEAGNGQQALDIAEHERNAIDLLLTDVVMPGMNGRELAEQLLAEQPTLHVLYTSGYPADTIIRHGIAEATAAYLEKPYLPDDLAHKIRDILDVPASA
jgi:PAS domain S-box-containing protein